MFPACFTRCSTASATVLGRSNLKDGRLNRCLPIPHRQIVRRLRLAGRDLADAVRGRGLCTTVSLRARGSAPGLLDQHGWSYLLVSSLISLPAMRPVLSHA